MRNGSILNIHNNSKNAFKMIFFILFRFIIKNIFYTNKIRIHKIIYTKNMYSIVYYYNGKTSLSYESSENIMKNLLLLESFNKNDAFIIGFCNYSNTHPELVNQLIKQLGIKYVVSY
jgi:hypothetical protein